MRFVIRDGQVVEKPARRTSSVFTAMSDIKPFVTTDGTEITSRSALREYERAHGVRQVGNDWSGPERPSFHDALTQRSQRR